MVPITKISGRLGNQMFQFAFLYAHSRDRNIDYYFQDPFYFDDYADEVRAIFSSDIPKRTDAVAIHVRRGDYINNAFYYDLMETDYYKEAMKLFPNEKFIVFSDDIEWCKKQEVFNDCVFFHGTETEDMNKMASCKGHIIANSTFSWWGAWLCPDYPKNKVVAPNNWFADKNERTILPDHWIKI